MAVQVPFARQTAGAVFKYWGCGHGTCHPSALSLVSCWRAASLLHTGLPCRLDFGFLALEATRLLRLCVAGFCFTCPRAGACDELQWPRSRARAFLHGYRDYASESYCTVAEAWPCYACVSRLLIGRPACVFLIVFSQTLWRAFFLDSSVVLASPCSGCFSHFSLPADFHV